MPVLYVQCEKNYPCVPNMQLKVWHYLCENHPSDVSLAEEGVGICHSVCEFLMGIKVGFVLILHNQTD
jgi:hypothetical protein